MTGRHRASEALVIYGAGVLMGAAAGALVTITGQRSGHRLLVRRLVAEARG